MGIRFKPIARLDFRKYKLKKVQQHIMNAIYHSIVYAIWKSRDIAVWEGFVQTPKFVVTWIREEVEILIKQFFVTI